MKKILFAVALLIWLLARILASCGASGTMGAVSGPEPEPSPAVTYILNTNTHKFHYPGCASVDEIAPKNYQEFFGSREEAIALGFVPCKRCNP